MKRYMPIAFCLLLLACSKKKKDEDVVPQDKLPSVTQEGKNTFGCLVNGIVLLPKGFVGVPNLVRSYDASYNNGNFYVGIYNIGGDNETTEQSLTLRIARNFRDAGNFPLVMPIQQASVSYSRINTATRKGCEYEPGDVNNQSEQSGQLTITKLDKLKGVIAGTFSVMLIKKGCDTIRVTDGRFDVSF